MVLSPKRGSPAETDVPQNVTIQNLNDEIPHLSLTGRPKRKARCMKNSKYSDENYLVDYSCGHEKKNKFKKTSAE